MKKKYTFTTYMESGVSSPYSYYRHSHADVIVYAENEIEARKKVAEIRKTDQCCLKSVEELTDKYIKELN